MPRQTESRKVVLCVKYVIALRIQHHGEPYRVLHAFDPKRNAVLLLGGNKTGRDRWYTENVPLAERIFEDYLRETGQK
jgi:hypothetical protein